MSVLKGRQTGQSASAAKIHLETLYLFLSCDTSDQSLNTKIRRLNDKLKQMKKTKNEKGFIRLMAADFEVPKSVTEPLQSLPPETQTLMKEK